MNFIEKIKTSVRNTDLLITVLEKILLIIVIFIIASILVRIFNRIIDYILKLKEEIKELEDIEIVFQIGQTKLSEEEKNKIEK